MSNTTNDATSPKPADSTAPSKTLGQKVVRVISAIVGVIFIVSGAIKIYNVFSPSLPGCASDTTNTVIHDIFKQKNVELTSLTNFKTVTDTSAEKICQADFQTPTEAGTLTYQISWQGNSAEVRITKVDTHPR